MHLIVGLGNPGKKYQHNRHNAGFMTLDALASFHNVSHWKEQFNSLIAEFRVETPFGITKVILLKPANYYNCSGECVGNIARYFKIPSENIIVFHDELDLDFGKFKVKTGGGCAGNNGLRSIVSHIGNTFWRARIGIGHPGDKIQVTPWVLSDFGKDAQIWLDILLKAIAESLPILISGQYDKFQTRVNYLAAAKDRI